MDLTLVFRCTLAIVLLLRCFYYLCIVLRYFYYLCIVLRYFYYLYFTFALLLLPLLYFCVTFITFTLLFRYFYYLYFTFALLLLPLLYFCVTFITFTLLLRYFYYHYITFALFLLLLYNVLLFYCLYYDFFVFVFWCKPWPGSEYPLGFTSQPLYCLNNLILKRGMVGQRRRLRFFYDKVSPFYGTLRARCSTD